MAKVEVILTHPIIGLGAESDLVKVAAGYARNFLLPQHLAILPSEGNKRRLEALRKRRAEREAHELNAMTELAKSLGKMTLIISVKTGDAVKQGQELARLDTTSLDLSVQSAQAALAIARSKYTTLLAGALPPDVASAEQSVVAAQAALAEANAAIAEMIEGRPDLGALDLLQQRQVVAGIGVERGMARWTPLLR